MLVVPAAHSSAQGVVDSMGFWVQFDGSLTACDTNPFFGHPTDMPFNDDPDVPWGVDLDPSYDWVIFETMVSDPVHPWPFYLWPSNAPNGEVPFGTHEIGYSMGILLVWEDTNGFDPSDWGTGRFLLRTMIGMNLQQDDGHSGLSWWTEMVGDLPWRSRFIGSAVMDSVGPWAEEYGPGWIIEGRGLTTSMDDVGGRRLDLYTDGWIHEVRFQSISQRHGDMNLNGGVDFGDIMGFMMVYIGGDEDETRVMLGDYTEDGFVGNDDFWLFMDALFRGG